jgi:hypothetical protein
MVACLCLAFIGYDFTKICFEWHHFLILLLCVNLGSDMYYGSCWSGFADSVVADRSEHAGETC